MPGASPAAAPVDPPTTDFPPTGPMPAAAPSYSNRPRRPSGEVPSLDARLEGLASRGRLNLASGPDDEVVVDHDETYDDDNYDDGFDDGAPRRRGWSRLAIALVVVALLFIGAVVGTGLWIRNKIDPGGPLGDVVTVEVVEGQSTSDIGQLLQDSDVITSSTVWTWYVRFKGGGDVQAGTYDLRENMSMGEALTALQVDPIPEERSVTIAEGLTVEQMVGRLTDAEDGVRGFDAERLRQAMTGGQIRSRFLPEGQANPEGTLFPDTYSLGEEDDEVALVQRMVTQMDTVLDEVEIETRAQELGRTPYEILIIASMIEEEARVAEERPQMARVVYNRLAADMPLGIDPTSCYESGECPPTSAELESDSPYNTRRNLGLPPTPISSPSRASIEAALAPAEGEWLFFVLKDSAGHHTFSVTEDEHEAAVQYCRDQGLCG
ncbi:MAG: endolytic transglycosylase MltG [Acidimicrobiales bacterium]